MTKWLLLLHLALVLSSCSGGVTSPSFEKLSELTSPDEDQATPPDVTGDGNALRAAAVPDEDSHEERGPEAFAGVFERLSTRANPFLRTRPKKGVPVLDSKKEDIGGAVSTLQGAPDWETRFAFLYSLGYNEKTVRAALREISRTHGTFAPSHVDTFAAAYAVYRAEQNAIAAKDRAVRVNKLINGAATPAKNKKAAAPSNDQKRTALASIEEGPSPRSVLELTSPPRVRKDSVTPFIEDLAKKHDDLLEQKRRAKEVISERQKEMNEAIAWLKEEKSQFVKRVNHRDIDAFALP